MNDLVETPLPEALSDLLFDRNITQKQRKFILLFVHSEGLKTATQCAIDAGYAAGSARVRASELQNPTGIHWLQKLLMQSVELLLKGTSVVRSVLYLHWLELETKRQLQVITMLL